MNRAWLLLVILGALCPGCVNLVHRATPVPLECEQPVLVSVRVEGFEVPYQHLRVSTTTGLLGIFGSGGSSGGSNTSVTTQIEDQVSLTVRDMAARYLEDVGLVQRASTEGHAGAQLTVEGEIEISGSWSNLWSAPLNVVTALLLVMPVTWASEVTCSLRVYAQDGSFLKSYTSEVERIRSWNHWATWSRVDAGNQRRSRGGLLSMRSVLDAFAHDAIQGVFDADVAAAPAEFVPDDSGEDPLIRAALGTP